MMKKLGLSVLLLGVALVAAWNFVAIPGSNSWSAEELQLINSLSIERLAPLPADPSNRVADLPAAAEFGHRLFFDTRLSGNGLIACATCHRPELMFTDAFQMAMGAAPGPRHTPSLVGLSHSPWYYWDGRKDSQWAQALAPLEAAIEHGIDRLQVARLIDSDSSYRQMYNALFGALPVIPATPLAASPLGDEREQINWNSLSGAQQNEVSRVFANLGKAIAAYERKLMPGAARFDAYARSIAASSELDQGDILSSNELAGLRLFIGKAQCVSCHNGPLFTNHEFHNTGVLSIAGQLPSMGRYDGIRTARSDPFNCLGEFSDAEQADCIELRFARDDNSLVGAQKTPTLRNVSWTAPYMHGGQLATLAAVLNHYNEAPLSMLSHNEAKPLALRPVERRQLEAFIRTLSAPLATEPKWLAPAVEFTQSN